jgi:septum formation protein
LTRAGFRFKIVPANIEEPGAGAFTEARTFVQHAAWLKAAAVAQNLHAAEESQVLILAADTVGWLHGEPIGKPADEADARRILHLLSGTEHELWTGICLWRHPDDVQLAWQEMSRVAMKRMRDAEIDTYLQTRQWQGCSGSYAIQEGDDPYVQVLQGSMSNVIGLPMEMLERRIASMVS